MPGIYRPRHPERTALYRALFHNFDRFLSWRHTVPVLLGMIEEEPRSVPSKGRAEMIRKIYEVDPLVCPRCGSHAVLMASMSAGG